jgi:hypothetical protein
MVDFYYASTHAQSTVSWAVYVILVNGILNVLFPAYYVLVVRREGLNPLGITRRSWWLALLLLPLSGAQATVCLEPSLDHAAWRGRTACLPKRTRCV